MRNLKTFGSMSVQKLCTLFFIIGSAGVLFFAIRFGYFISTVFKYDRMFTQYDGTYTFILSNNPFVGMLAGFLALGLGLLLWRLICEALFIVLTYFKNNTKNID